MASLVTTTVAGTLTATGDITTNSTTHAYVVINSSAANRASWVYHKQGGATRWLAGVELSQTRYQLYSTVTGSTGVKFALDTSGNGTFSGGLTATTGTFSGLLTPSLGVAAHYMTGTLNVNSNQVSNVLRMTSSGTIPASEGWLRIANNNMMVWRNAGNSANVKFGVNAGDHFEFTNGNVGIGTTSPDTDLHVLGTSAGTTFKFVDGDGRIFQDLSGGILSWSAASVFGSTSWGSTADFQINSLTGGRQTLQVNGAAGASHSLRVTGATTAGTPTAWIHNSNNTAGADCLVVSSVSENDAEVFAIRTNTTTYSGGDTDFIVKLVNNSPRVGIGVAAPTTRLHVEGGGINVTSLSTANTASMGLRMGYTGVTNTNGYICGGISMGNSGEEYAGMFAVDNGSGAATGLGLFVGSAAGIVSDALRILSDGKVGIGTTAPAALLHVYSGSVAFTSLTDNVDSVQIGRDAFATTHPDAKLYIKDNSSADWGVKIDLSGYSYGLNIQNFNNHGFQITHDTLGYVLNVYAASMVINEDGGNYDFRVEGDTDTHLLFTDASTDRVGIGTNAPGALLEVDGSGSGTPLKLKSGSGGGAIDFIGRSSDNISALGWYENNGSSGGSYLQSNGTWMRARADGGFHFRKGNTPTVTDTDGFTIEGMNVGIGTATPSRQLEVYGAAGSSTYLMRLHSPTAGGEFLEMIGDAGNPVWQFHSGGTGGEGIIMGYNDNALKVQIAADTDHPTYFLASNVGIGTATPAANLHIYEATTDTPLQITRAANTGNGMIKFETGTTDDWIVGLRNDSTSDFRFYSYGTSSDALTIKRADGKVGIGTTSPDSALHVYDTSSGEVRFQRVTGYAGLMRFGFPSGTPSIRTSGNFQIKASDAWGADLYIKSDGNVGIGGATALDNKLEVLGNLRLRNAPSTNPSIKLNNGDVEVVALELDTGATGVLGLRDHSLNIDVNGNVGIGTNAPEVRLHIDAANGLPATTGTVPNGFLGFRSKTAGATHALFMGVSNASPWSSWLQAQDGNALGTSYPLLLNPNGGKVGIGTTNPGYLLDVRGTVYVNGTTYIAADTRLRGKLSRDGGPVSAGTETWFIRPSASNTVIVALTNSAGGALANGGCYRFTAHINGTGTDQSARAVFWNQNGTWYVNKTSQYSGTSNQPEFLVSSGVPSIKTSHSSQYLIPTMCERIVLDEGSGTDNTREYYGADGFMSSITSTEVLSYNVGTTTSRTVYHSGNFTPGNYLPLAGGTLTGGLTGTSATFSSAVTGASLNVLNGSSIFARTHSSTNGAIQILNLKATSSGDMADGFGPSIVFAASDTGTTSNQVAEINAVRAGSDTVFNLEFQTADITRLTLGASAATFSGTVKGDGDATRNLGTTSARWLNAYITKLAAADGGESAPSHTFQNDTNTGMFRRNTDLLAFSTAGAERLCILADGKVGIGTTNPGYLLDVRGTVKVNGTTYISAASTATRLKITSTGGSGGASDIDIDVSGGTYGYPLRVFSGAGGSMVNHARITTGGDIISDTGRFVQSANDSNPNSLYDTNFSGTVRPSADNTYALGNASYRWSNVSAVLGTFGGALTAASATFSGDVQIGSYSVSEDRTLAILGDNVKNETLRLADASSNYGFDIRNNGAGSRLEFIRHSNSSTGTVAAVIKRDSGNFGIGTTAPNAKLDISDATNDNLRIGTRGGNMNLFSVTDGGAGAPLAFEGTEFHFITGKVGIGTTTPATLLHIESSLPKIRLKDTGGTTAYDIISDTDTFKIHEVYNNRDLFTMTSGAVITFNSGGSLTKFDTSNAVVVPNGNVGIGTSAPSRLLHLQKGTGSSDDTEMLSVAGRNSYISLDSGRSGTRGESGFFLRNNNTNVWEIYKRSASSQDFSIYDYGPTNSGIKFRIPHAGTSMYLMEGGGNVGIGETSPDELLHVKKSTGAVGIKVESVQDGSAYGANLYLQTYNTSANAKIHFGDRIGLYGFIDYENSDDHMAFGTNNAERMRIKSNGSVGIGTTAPDTNLEIYQSDSNSSYVHFTNSTTGGGADNGTLVGIDAAENFRIHNYEATDNIFVTNGIERMRILSDGKVGIGTATPGQRLDVINGAIRVSSTGETKIFFRETVATDTYADRWTIGNDDAINNAFVFSTGATFASPKLIIQEDGNVGIGTTDPDQALEIGAAGKLKLSRADNSRSMLLYTDNSYGTIETDVDPILIKSAHRITFSTNGANERMRITETGSVLLAGDALLGINTADAADTGSLNLSGGGAFSDTRAACIGLAGNEDGNAGLMQLRAGDGSVGGIRMYTGGTERVRITDTLALFRYATEVDGDVTVSSNSTDVDWSNNSNVVSTGGGGIMVSNQQSLDNTFSSIMWVAKETAGTDQNFAIINQSTAATAYTPKVYLAQRTAANTFTAALTIDESQNVGIGTTNPSQLLDVNGTTRLRGALYDKNNSYGTSGQVLSTTGSGGVDWVSAGGSGTVTSVATGTGLTGGTITTSGTISLTTAGAGAGSHGSTSNSTKIDTITLDAYGRVTAVATGATGSGNGTVTSVATSGAITGGTITTSGTIAHSTSAGYKHIPSGGASAQFLKYSSSGTAVWAGGVFNSDFYVHVGMRTTAASGTDGGTLTSNTWTTRDLNHTYTNNGGFATVSTMNNVVQLTAGTYYVKFWVTGYGVQEHQAQLVNGTYVWISGSNERSSSSIESSNSVGEGVISWGSGTKDMSIRQIVDYTKATYGGGRALDAYSVISSGNFDYNTYWSLEIWKVG